jgi:2-polyprenyl-3-methyl-5-hydroxy-6-metoxy-1,4-benzoquinol methylase
MDDLSCSGEVVGRTLRELDIINKFLGGSGVTMSGLRELARRHDPDSGPLAVVDLGCGSGDLLCQMARFGRAQNIPMHLTGIDANPFIVEYAKRHCKDYPEIQFEVQNVFSDDFARRSFDIIAGTLFFHHFDDDTLRMLLPRLLRQSRIGVIINDIHRHALAYYTIRVLTGFLSSSSMVRYDAPLSVRRAFVRADWEKIFRESGMKNWQLSWKWAFRWSILLTP